MQDLATYLKTKFGFSQKEVDEVYKKITIRSLDLILQKIEFYKETLKLTDAELSKMIKSFPALLNYDTITDKSTSVKSKLSKLYEMGFDDKDIVQNPKYLSYPAQSLKIRYILLQLNGVKIGDFLMTNENLVLQDVNILFIKICLLKVILIVTGRNLKNG